MCAVYNLTKQKEQIPEAIEITVSREFAPHSNSVPVQSEADLYAVTDINKITYDLEGHHADIFKPIYNSGMYQVMWNTIDMGYIYISHMDEITETSVWVASTPFLQVYVNELSTFIEISDF